MLIRVWHKIANFLLKEGSRVRLPHMSEDKDKTRVYDTATHSSHRRPTRRAKGRGRRKLGFSDKTRYVNLSILLLGLILIGRGATLWNEGQSGVVIENWVTPATTIPGHALVLTWGVGGSSPEEPDLWHFHVSFSANETAHVLLVWNLNESVLFERRGMSVNETFDATLPRTQQAWRWDWMIENPESAVLAIQNFTIVHYPIRFTERQNSIAAIGTGLAIAVAASFAFYYFSHQRTRRRRRSRSR